VSIGFLNLSLAFNSVGCVTPPRVQNHHALLSMRVLTPPACHSFYQMTKLAIIPATVTLQTLFYAKTFTTRVKLCLLVLLLVRCSGCCPHLWTGRTDPPTPRRPRVQGVAVAQVNDVELNALGCVVSVFAVITTCVSQIWTGSMQKQHGVTSTQLLHNASPIMAATLLVIGVPVDAALMSPEAAALFTFSVPSIFFTLLSCLIAVSVNFSTFLVIGKCDAVTYQVLGHLKTVLILVLGFVALKNPANPRAIGGIFIAMVGMVAYAHEEQRAQAAAQSGAAQEKAAALEKAVLGVEGGAGTGAGGNGDTGMAMHGRDSSGSDLELKVRGPRGEVATVA
jgi:solute carrier family 35 protein E3